MGAHPVSVESVDLKTVGAEDARHTVSPKDPLLLAFAAALKRERLRAGLSQETLASEAGLSRTQTSALERAIREPKLGTILKLCEAMGIPPGQLLDALEP